MKLSLPATLTLLLLAAILLAPVAAAQTNDSITPDVAEGEDDAPIQRVARISFLEGDVSFLRAGVNEWASVAENLPLFTGDQVYTGKGARAEIQLSRGNYIRLSEHTALTITELAHTTAQFEITEGTALIRLERFGTAFDRFEVNTPNAALTLEQDGFYRVNVRGDNESEVITRQGSIEVVTADGSFKVREGHRLVIDTTTGRLEIAVNNSLDNWDQWSTDRDRTIDRGINIGQVINGATTVLSLVFNRESENHCFYGASELTDHGSWVSDPGYGHCWVPRVGAGWAPYRHGQWLWVPSAGWTWLSSEPWGWAPYHYGRWAFIPSYGWAWVPGIGSRHTYGHSYYQWRPALVGFFNSRTPNGDYIGWYPLSPGERWRRPDHRRDGDHSHLRYPTTRDGAGRPRTREGLTVLPTEGFIRPDRSKVRPTAPDRDMHGWINNGARPGLPEIAPSQRAVAPVWHHRNRERAIKPPSDIISRPVVTRNQPADTQIESAVPRERRLISPPRQNDSMHMPSREGRNRNQQEHDHLAPKDKREQKGRQESGEENSKNKERSRPVFIPAQPVTRDHSSGDTSTREREKRPPAAERPRPRDDDSSKPRQHQPQPRPEYRDQERQQERRQEKQERREERSNSGKKNKDHDK